MIINKIKSYLQFEFKEIFYLVLEIYFRKNSKAHYLLVNTRWIFEKLLNQGYQIKKVDKANIIYDFGESRINVFLRRNSSDSRVFSQVLFEMQYEALVNYIHSKNETINTVIDCGANIGLTSLYLNKKFPNAKIISVEPDRNNLISIEKNIKINNVVNIEIERAGIWKNESNLAIDTDFRDGESWALTVKETEDTINAIKGVTIQSILKKHLLQHIDILKIDIEGAERFLFSDFSVYNEFMPKVKFLAIEIHDEFEIREQIYKVLNEYDCEFINVGELTIAYKK